MAKNIQNIGRDHSMKILAVNFQRLGDILMSAPLLNELKKNHSGLSLHLFCFEEFKAAAEVMTMVDEWHFLSREKIFETIRSERSSVFDAGDWIDEKLQSLNQLEFDQIINLSHTEFSSQICGLIDAKEKKGTVVEGSAVLFSSDVFKELDAQTDLEEHHLLDWFRKGFDQTGISDWTFSQEKHTASVLKEGRSLYLFQILSSEEKKGWTRERWALLFQQIRKRDPFAELKILCAPMELKLLSDFATQNDMELVAGSLRNAYLLIKRADYFITLDTSTKHLANDSDCKVVELSLGSSSYLKQSIYKRDAVILAPKIECYPCSPREKCPLVQRRCAAEIEVSDILKALDFMETGKAQNMSCKAFVTCTDSIWKIETINWKGERKLENTRESTEDYSKTRNVCSKDY